MRSNPERVKQKVREYFVQPFQGFKIALRIPRILFGAIHVKSFQDCYFYAQIRTFRLFL